MTGDGAANVVLEAGRIGRRPRYHRGARLANGQLLQPEQCNLDQSGGAVRQLEELPALRRPWAQLCRRCWAGSPELESALALGVALP